METIRPTNGASIGEIWDDYMTEDRELDPTFYASVALGNGTQLTIGMFWADPEQDGDETLFVGIEGFGAYSFNRKVDYGYLGSKIRGLMDWDYKNIADFINRQLGLMMEKPQGEYLKECTK